MPSGHPTRGVLHPLSEHAREVLRRLERDPIPRSSINPGVRDRFVREGLIRFEDLLRGKRLVTHAVITDAGRARAKP
jgi:hypothetical protein